MIACMSWLVPAAGPVRDRLAGVITRLAGEHGGPVFPPHVTMADVVESSAEAAARVLERLVTEVAPFEVTLTEVGYEPEFFRALYLRAEPTAILTALHEAGERAWGLDISGTGPPLPVTIRVDAAEVWGDFTDDVTRWRRLARVRLEG